MTLRHNLRSEKGQSGYPLRLEKRDRRSRSGPVQNRAGAYCADEAGSGSVATKPFQVSVDGSSGFRVANRDTLQFGVQNLRRGLEPIIEYSVQQISYMILLKNPSF